MAFIRRLLEPRLIASFLMVLLPTVLACDATSLGLAGGGDDDEMQLPVPDAPRARVEDGILVIEWDPVDGADSYTLTMFSGAFGAEFFEHVLDTVVVKGATSPYRVPLEQVNEKGNVWAIHYGVNADGTQNLGTLGLEAGLELGAYRITATIGERETIPVDGESIHLPLASLSATWDGCFDSLEENGMTVGASISPVGDSVIVYWDSAPVGNGGQANRHVFTRADGLATTFCHPTTPGTTYHYRTLGYNESGSSGLSPEGTAVAGG